MGHEGHNGAMIALIPAVTEAERLAVPGGEAPEDLHVTLWYSSEGVTLPTEFQDRMHQVGEALTRMLPLTADAFSVNLFNPGSEDVCVVLGIGGSAVANAHAAVVGRIGNGDTKEPWVAHLTLEYLDVPVPNPDLSVYMERLGPIVFDRVRVAIGEDFIDHVIGDPEEVNMEATVDIEDRDSEYASAETDCGCPRAVDEGVDEGQILASVNTNTWSSLPIADRETEWDADDAIARISSWAGGNGNKFGSPFLWKAKDGQPLNPDSYRLPIADVVNGKLVMIPRAVFEAAKILSGAHGALEGVVSEPEREALKSTVTEIYNKLQKLYQDPRVVAPWLKGRTKEERAATEAEMKASIDGVTDRADELHPILASVNSSGWASMPVADPGTDWDGDAARAAVKSWADGDMDKYRRAFLWWDSSAPGNFGSYKMPIATVIDGTLTIVPRAVSAAWGAIHGARDGVDIPASDKARIEGILERLRRRLDLDDESRTASGVLAPSREWFNDPELTEPTLFTVTADGRVYGHLAQWNVCHAGVMNKCLLAPKSITNYRYFRNGHVLTDDGSMVRVGRLTVGTGHADRMQGLIAAAEHYDNSGTAVAVVTAGEDRFGIWVHGAVVAGASQEKVAELRRSPLSGDWRRSPEGNLELVAALAVNTPGFPILYEADGQVASLVAAGMMVAPEDVVRRRSYVIDGMDQMLTKHFEHIRRDRFLHIFGG